MDHLKSKGDLLWQEFKEHYRSALDNHKTDFDEIYKNYKSPSIRTDLNSILLDEVAKKMASPLILDKEFLNIDFSLSKKAVKGGYDIPLILVEHENDIDSEPKNHEILKLCSTSAPLKVFITWYSGDWSSKSEEYLTDYWSFMINSVMDVQKSLFGTLAIIVAEIKSNNVTYYTMTWDESKERFEPEQPLYSAFVNSF